MTLVRALAILQNLGPVAFRTADAAAVLRLSRTHASKLLSRLAGAGHLQHLGQGLWGLTGKVGLWDLPELFTTPLPACISLQSALYRHGLVSPIPAVVYAVSPARTRKITTPIGTVSIHHVQPSFFFGYETSSHGGQKIATPEKALVDFLYLSPTRSRLFAALPEVTFPRGFRITRVHEIIQHIPAPRRRELVARLFRKLLAARAQPARSRRRRA